FLYKDFDLCAGRKTAVYEDHMCFADPATAAAHVIADLAQQLLFTHLEAEVCCRLLEFFQQRLLRPTPPHQLVHRLSHTDDSYQKRLGGEGSRCRSPPRRFADLDATLPTGMRK